MKEKEAKRRSGASAHLRQESEKAPGATGDRPGCMLVTRGKVLPPLSVGEMTLRLYGALSYSQNSARDLRCALNGA